jgi:hypothetical protein
MVNNQIWEVKEGFFLPFQITPSTHSTFITPVLKDVELTKNQSIYLRGSFLENNSLHQNSDVDLIVIGESIDKTLINNLKRKLSFTKRSIEILSLTPAQVENSSIFRLLLQTRSLHLKGRVRFFSPVKANLETMKDHFFHFRPHMIFPILSMDKSIRLIQLKLITRSYGVLYFLHSRDKFSRDIETCLFWAKEIDEIAGRTLQKHWENLDLVENYKKEDISSIISRFLIEFEKAIKKYLTLNNIKPSP